MTYRNKIRDYLFITAAIFLGLGAGSAQVGGGHTLFGDLKIEGSQVQGMPLSTFYVILYGIGSNLGIRQPVPPNGRYRFLNVSNGEYELAVEVEGEEIVRIHLLLNERIKTDLRRDIHLQWRQDSQKRAGGDGPQSVSVPDLYKRKPANQNLFNRAQEVIGKGDNTAAARLLQELVSGDPGDFEAWIELGTLYFKDGKFEGAEKAYLRALEGSPSSLLALLNLAKLYFAEKRYEAAVPVLTRAIDLPQPSADAQFLIGEAYLQVKKGSLAVVHFHEALRLDPAGKADAHMRLAALYHAAGMRGKAAEEYQRYLAKKPDHPGRQKLQEYIRQYKNPQDSQRP